METPIFFENGNYKLFGVLHSPQSNRPNEQTIKRTGIVLCHPLFEEKLISHRFFVNMARLLADEGFYCLRFDFMGHGDSDGDFENISITSQISDICCALSFFKNQTEITAVGLLGVRFGATLAALACSEISGIDFLIMISPILNGSQYMQQCLRTNLAMQLALYKNIIKNRDELIDDLLKNEMVNIDGYMLTRSFYEAVNNINLLDLCPFSRNVFLLHLQKNENQPLPKDLTVLQEISQNNLHDLEICCVKGNLFWLDGKIYKTFNYSISDHLVNFLFNLKESEYGK